MNGDMQSANPDDDGDSEGEEDFHVHSSKSYSVAEFDHFAKLARTAISETM